MVLGKVEVCLSGRNDLNLVGEEGTIRLVSEALGLPMFDTITGHKRIYLEASLLVVRDGDVE